DLNRAHGRLGVNDPCGFSTTQALNLILNTPSQPRSSTSLLSTWLNRKHDNWRIAVAETWKALPGRIWVAFWGGLRAGSRPVAGRDCGRRVTMSHHPIIYTVEPPHLSGLRAGRER